MFPILFSPPASVVCAEQRDKGEGGRMETRLKLKARSLNGEGEHGGGNDVYKIYQLFSVIFCIIKDFYYYILPS